MNGYRKYRTPLGRAVDASLFDDEFSAEVVEITDTGGQVVELIEGRQAQLDGIATARGWQLESERVVTPS